MKKASKKLAAKSRVRPDHKVLPVRLTERQDRIIVRAAKARGLKKSAFVREMALKAAK